MRVDKYLKVARILKRRTVSKELALNERVKINDRVVKPSHEIKVGDKLEIQYGSRVICVRVLSLQENKRKKDNIELYEIISEKKCQLAENINS